MADCGDAFVQSRDSERRGGVNHEHAQLHSQSARGHTQNRHRQRRTGAQVGRLGGYLPSGRPLTWEIRERSGKIIFWWKSQEIHENLSKSGKNEIVLTNDLENVDVAHFVSYFVKGLELSVLLFAILLTIRSQGKTWKVWEKSGKMKT